MARTLAELDVSWFEEPLEIENERGYRELCRLSPVPVAAGENACTLEKIVRLIDAGVHVIQPDVGWTSGITTALAIAKVAEARSRAPSEQLGRRFLFLTGGGLLRPSSRHRRLSRLWFTVQPSRRTTS